MVVPSPPPRYDRIVSLVLIVILGLAVIFLIDANPNNFRAVLGGDLPAITVSWLLIILLVLVTSTGADVFIRAHPQMQMRRLPTLRLGRYELEIAPAFWLLPSLSVIASFAFSRLFSGILETTAFIIALVAVGVLLFGSLIGQHYALDRRPDVRRNARLVLQAITFVLAFSAFSAVYYARLRFLYSGVLLGVLGSLLAYAVLHWTPPRKGLVLLSCVVGVVLAEAMWALNYWSAQFLLGGTLLLVIFYTVVGVLQNHLEGTLSRNVFWEYGLLGGGLLVAVLVVTFR